MAVGILLRLVSACEMGPSLLHCVSFITLAFLAFKSGFIYMALLWLLFLCVNLVFRRALNYASWCGSSSRVVVKRQCALWSDSTGWVPALPLVRRALVLHCRGPGLSDGGEGAVIRLQRMGGGFEPVGCSLTFLPESDASGDGAVLV